MTLNTKLRHDLQGARRRELGVLHVCTRRLEFEGHDPEIQGVMTLVLVMDNLSSATVELLRELLDTYEDSEYCAAIELPNEHLIVWQQFSDEPIRNAGSFLKNVALKSINFVLDELDEQEEACPECGDIDGTCDCDDPNFIADGMEMSGLNEDDPQDCAEYYGSDDPSEWGDDED